MASEVYVYTTSSCQYNQCIIGGAGLKVSVGGLVQSQYNRFETIFDHYHPLCQTPSADSTMVWVGPNGDSMQLPTQYGQLALPLMGIAT